MEVLADRRIEKDDSAAPEEEEDLSVDEGAAPPVQESA